MKTNKLLNQKKHTSAASVCSAGGLNPQILITTIKLRFLMLVFFGFAALARATVLVSIPFNYTNTAGLPLTLSNFNSGDINFVGAAGIAGNFTKSAGAGTLTTAAAISYTNADGGKVLAGASGLSITNTDYTSVTNSPVLTGQTLFTRFVWRTVNNSRLILSLGNSGTVDAPSTSNRPRFDFNAGMSCDATGIGSTSPSASAYNANTTYLVVGRLNWDGTKYSSMDIWVNPPYNGGVPNEATKKTASGGTNTVLNAPVIRGTLGAAGLLSSFVVATDWTNVVPVNTTVIVTTNWNQTAAGTYDWNAVTNWQPNTQFPNGTGVVANVNIDIAGAQTNNLNQAITVGTLNLGDSQTNFFPITIASNTAAGSLTFDTASGAASLVRTANINPGSSDIINAPVILNKDLNVSLPWLASGNGIVLNGNISGVGGMALLAKAAPATAASDLQSLDFGLITNNSFAGNFELANGVVKFRGDVIKGTNSALGNSTNAIKVGSLNSLLTAGSPDVSGQTTMDLQLIAGDDTSPNVFTRDIDLTGNNQLSATLAATGRARFSFLGNQGGGANSNTLTFGGTMTFTLNARDVEVLAERQGMSIYFTNALYASVAAGNGAIHWGPSSPGATSIDGPTGGTYRFSDLPRTYRNSQYLSFGTVVIEGSVGIQGVDSPIGWQPLLLSDNYGGNIAQTNAVESVRSLFLATPGASYDRAIAPGRGGSALTPYNGGFFHVMNGYQFGGLNTSGTVTFTGNISPSGSDTGLNPTNQTITVNQNIALIAATGGTVEFSGAIGDVPNTSTNTGNVRITINQLRNHPQLDSNLDGIPDPGVADALVGTPTGGKVVLSGFDNYAGTTEVLGGTLQISGFGTIYSSSAILVTAGKLRLVGSGDHISDGIPVTLGGGSLPAGIALSGDVSETVGTLVVTGGIPATIDFGTGADAAIANSVLTFANSSAVSWGNSLKVTNWSGSLSGGGTNQLLVGSDNTGLTSGQLANISFVQPNGASGSYAAVQLSTGEVVPQGPLVFGPSTPPNFPANAISVSGGTVSLTATGAIGGTYKLWASTNLALTPVTNTWTLLQSGTITVSPFTITDPGANTNKQRFYLFSAP